METRSSRGARPAPPGRHDTASSPACARTPRHASRERADGAAHTLSVPRTLVAGSLIALQRQRWPRRGRRRAGAAAPRGSVRRHQPIEVLRGPEEGDGTVRGGAQVDELVLQPAFGLEDGLVMAPSSRTCLPSMSNTSRSPGGRFTNSSNKGPLPPVRADVTGAEQPLGSVG
jgi:hypothetical protein